MTYFSVEVDALRGRAGDILEVAESLNTLSRQTMECAEELGSFSNSFSSIADSLRVVAENVTRGSINSTQLGTALTSIVRAYQETEQRIIDNFELPEEIEFTLAAAGEDLENLRNTNPYVPGGGKSPISMFDGDPVDMSNGNYVDDVSQLRFYGATTLNSARHYNSLYLNVGPMGIGWSHNFNVSLLIKNSEIIVIWGDQTNERYLLKEDGRFINAVNPREYIEVKNAEFHLRKRNKDTLCFDVMGKLIRYSNEKPNSEVVITYDEKDRIIEATDKFGHSISYSYGESGLLEGIRDNAGRAISFEYDSIFLTAAIAADGLVTRYEYDEKGRLNKITDPDGNVRLINTYDDKNRVVHQVMADGGEMSFDYSADHVKITDPYGVSTTYVHDEIGRVVTVKYPSGIVHNVYNSSNQKTEYTDPNGNVFKRDFDEAGNVISFTNPLGAIATFSYDDHGNRTEANIPTRGAIRNEYDECGNITKHIDGLGNTTEYRYDNGFLTEVLYPDEATLTFSYDEAGRLSCVVDEMGHARSFKYDLAGRKSEETDGCGNVTRYTYDNADRILTIVNPQGQTRTFTYEGGRLVKVTDFDGYSEEAIYDASGRVSQHTDKNGNKTCYEYDLNSNVTKITLPNGKEILRKYDDMNRMIESAGPEKEHRTLKYDANGNCICKEDNGQKTTYEYDGLDRIVKETGARQTIEYTYDEGNNLVKKVINGALVYEYAYDAVGGRILMTDPEKGSERFVYDSRRRLVERTDDLGHAVKYSYYADGKLEKVVFPDGSFEQKEYDANGRVTSVTNQAGYKLSTEYDSLGRVIRKYDSDNRERSWKYINSDHGVIETDALGNATEYKYSPTGQVIFMKDPTGQETRYLYNEMDDVVAVLRDNMTDKEAEVFFAGIGDNLGENNDSIRCTAWERDSFGRILARIDAKGNRHEWSYGADGELLREIDENGNEINREYDEHLMLTKISFPDGTHASYKYDDQNRISEINDWTGKLNLAYNNDGNLLYSVDANDQKVSYRYDEVGRRVGIVYPDGNEASYVYNDRNQIIHLATASFEADYTFDDAQNLESRKVRMLGTSDNREFTEHYTYNPAGKVVALKQNEGDKPLSEYKYDYDNFGNMIFKSVIMYEGAQKISEDYRYEYDDLGHLSKVFSVVAGQENLKEEYRYDRFGNCTYSNVAGKERINKYDVLDCLVNSCSPDGDYNVDYSYNKKGELISTSGSEDTSREYGFDGRLRSFRNGGEITTININSLGGMVSERNAKGEKKDYWIDYNDRTQSVLGTNDGEGWRSFYRDYKLLGSAFGETAGLFMSDEKGSVNRFLAGSEDWTNTSEDLLYSSYGQVLSRAEDLSNTFGMGYTGLEAEATGNTWRTATREFDPSVGRFLSRDKDEFLRLSNPNGLNQYQYCFGNPVLWVDPMGTDCYVFYYPEHDGHVRLAHSNQSQLARQYGCDESEVHLIPINSKEEFIQAWSNMGTENGKKVDIDTVVLDFHADPTYLGSKDGSWYFTPEDISQLPEKDVENLVCYGCNSGHTDYVGENIASALAKRVKGAPVLASDGTVSTSGNSAVSNNDDTFKKLRRYGDRENEGWIAYYEDENGNIVARQVSNEPMTPWEMQQALKKYNKKYRCMMSGGGPSAGGEVPGDTPLSA